jgi:uncharacterized protein YbaP (TraB family)
MAHPMRCLIPLGLAGLLLVGSPVRAENPPKVFMWRAVSPTATVFLLGTMHFGRPDLYPLDRAITRAFDRSAVLVVEADVSPARMAELIFKVRGLMTYPPGRDLKSDVSAKTFKLLKAYCRKAGLPLASYLRFKPWALALVLPALAMKKLGYSETQGLDVHLLTRARAAGKQVAALESTLGQLKMLANMTRSQQEAVLAQALGETRNVQKFFHLIIAAWQKGNAAAIERLTLKADKEVQDPLVSQVYRWVIDRRNRTMAAAAAKYLSQHRTVFMAVGAMHLVGPRGVVSLLRKQGFKVVQVRAQGRPAR